MLILVVLTVVFITSYYFLTKSPQNRKTIDELRNEYPILDVIPPTSDIAPTTVERVVSKVSDTVILCEILENPQINETDLYNPGTPESQLYEETKSFGPPKTASFYDYQVNVLDDFSEYTEESKSLKDKTITITISSELSDSASVFKKGMRLVLPVAEGAYAHSGKYFFTHTGAYYVLKDDTVLSTYKEDSDFLYGGKQLKELKKEMKQLLRKR